MQSRFQGQQNRQLLANPVFVTHRFVV